MGGARFQRTICVKDGSNTFVSELHFELVNKMKAQGKVIAKVRFDLAGENAKLEKGRQCRLEEPATSGF